ncbi:DUF2793 domain-containing protein [Parerythrobacter jejuensis]|uniref:DUF2793 domain-containing protein n=1 Tax=Parerythrobacter jejuensis TaxID=795812 RepID=A0A845AVB4_9SPHN|nr:DUF2793 domain-containing protein [Parerythrobacter jejuensis]MXP30768.1 DUF2793 domain-containing protein [Parerythrobacter jejuensis]MXP33528.1 DUF2793 domain-containing protein [Parerythrobacter jejuensis]
MTQPIEFQSTSARHGLPLLFAAQAQKEAIVNEGLLRIDALLHPRVEEQISTPPATAGEGQIWLVGQSPTGAWAGQEDCLASFSGGDWLFLDPTEGMQCYDATRGQILHYSGQWEVPAKPLTPSGGQLVDAEARATLEALIAALVAVGVFPA